MFKYIANIYRLFLFSNNIEGGASSKDFKKPGFMGPIDMTYAEQMQKFKDKILDGKIDKSDAEIYLSQVEIIRKQSMQDLIDFRDDIKKTLLIKLEKGIVLDSLKSLLYVNDVMWKNMVQDQNILKRLEQGENINMKLVDGILQEFNPKEEQIESEGEKPSNFSIISSANADKLPTIKTHEKLSLDQQTFSKLIYDLETNKLFDKKGSKITIQDGKVFITTGIDDLTKLNISEKALKKGQHLTSFAINKDNYEKYLKDGNLQKLIDKKVAQWEKLDKKKD